MKKILSIISISLLALATASAQSDDVYYSNNNDAYAYSSNDNTYDNSYNNSTQDYSQNFYEDLAPYGQWVDYPGYGNVWVPAQVDADFSPYLTAGHWVYSDYGWTWASDYDWGWAAFHYGRWFHDVSMGWMWMPGNEWAPAWVTWGSYNNNYCWAPIAPGYGFSTYYRPDAHYWNFVPCEHITQPYVSNYVVTNTVVNHNVNIWNVERNITVMNNANTYNHVKYASGPRVNDVERVSGRRVEQVSVSNASRPAASRLSGNNLQIYRPAISSTATHIDRSAAQPRGNVRTDVRNSEPAVRSNTYSPAAHSIERPVGYERINNQSQPAQRNYERTAPQNISRPSYESQPVQRTENRPAQPQRTYSQPVNNARADYQSQPAQRSYERSAPQNISRPSYESQPVQRTESRPAQPQFSQPQRNYSQPAQRTESRPQMAQLSHSGRSR